MYAAGGLLSIINQTGRDINEKFYFIGRLEWNWTDDISNKDLSNLTSYAAFGFFKNISYEYVWAVQSGSDSECNDSGTELALEDDIDIGTKATRTPFTGNIHLDVYGPGYSYFSVSRASSPLDGYCVAVNSTCNKIYIYKYDKRAGFSSCANSRYLRDSNLIPGGIERLTLDVFAPRGLPDGTLKQATLTFVAS
jgi:hypothetical protein